MSEVGATDDAVIRTFLIADDRTENVQIHPRWGLLLSRLWVR